MHFSLILNYLLKVKTPSFKVTFTAVLWGIFLIQVLSICFFFLLWCVCSSYHAFVRLIILVFLLYCFCPVYNSLLHLMNVFPLLVLPFPCYPIPQNQVQVQVQVVSPSLLNPSVHYRTCTRPAGNCCP